MQKQLKMILTALILENTAVISSDVVGIAEENNAASSTQNLHTLAREDVMPSLFESKICDANLMWESFSHLALKDMVKVTKLNHNFRGLFQKWLSKDRIEHLNHFLPVSVGNLSGYLNLPGFKLPFYYAPKKISQMVHQPRGWRMILPLLTDEKHVVQDKRLLIQNSLWNPQAILELHNTQGLMEDLGLSPETRQSIEKRAAFLKDLPTQNILNFVKRQEDPDLKALGYLFIAQNQDAFTRTRRRAADALSALGNEYKFQAAQAYFEIATHTGLYIRDRNYATEALEKKFEQDYPLAVMEAYLSIANDDSLIETVTRQDRLTAAQKLYQFKDMDRERFVQTYFLMGNSSTVSTDTRLYAADVLAQFQDNYKRCAAEIYHSIATNPIPYLIQVPFHLEDTKVHPKVWAVNSLKNMGDEYTDFLIESCLSVINDATLDVYDRCLAVDILAEFTDEKHKENVVGFYTSIAMNPYEKACDRIHVAKKLAGLGEEYRPVLLNVCRLIATGERILLPQVSLLDASYTIYADDRIDAAKILYFHGDQKLAVEVCHRVAQNPDSSYRDQILAAKALAEFGPEHTQHVADICLPILEKESSSFVSWDDILEDLLPGQAGPDNDNRLDAAKLLAKFGDAYKAQILKACLSIIHNNKANNDIKLDAERILAGFGGN